MIRRVIAGLVVVGLAIGIWVLWPRAEPSPSPTTTTHAVASSTSTKVATRTTSSTLETHVVTTVEEAEEILRQLWFGWFEGIYNQDEERIKEVVATQALLDDAVTAFPTATFNGAPTESDIQLTDGELLFADQECLVVWATLDVTDISGEGAIETSVYVMRWVGGAWRLTTLWVHRDDLWERDCDAVLDPLS
ncbi:MAG TPA: hypothetical protein VI193_02230 [Acidimicrobiia bacterium]